MPPGSCNTEGVYQTVTDSINIKRTVGTSKLGLERAMGFEPTTTCLGSKDSTTELRPLSEDLIQEHRLAVQL